MTEFCGIKNKNMQNRINVLKTQPEAYKAMMGMENFIAGTNLKPLHKELIKIRASQINGCAYCINMHTKDARKLGETEQRIYLLNAWKETKLYTEEERVILQLTEEITQISHNQVSNETYAKAIAVFDEAYFADLVMMIVTINMWNRIGIFSELQPATAD
jgi:AhpD family alkylhydroperoxidase